MSTMHRPAAAWSRDALMAWEYVFANCEPTRSTATDKAHSHYHFMQRWAVKTVNLVNEEMGYCDWYWFLCRYFDEKLSNMFQHHVSIARMEFRDPNTRETDPEAPK